jgi:hypothetical protein
MICFRIWFRKPWPIKERAPTLLSGAVPIEPNVIRQQARIDRCAPCSTSVFPSQLCRTGFPGIWVQWCWHSSGKRTSRIRDALNLSRHETQWSVRLRQLPRTSLAVRKLCGSNLRAPVEVLRDLVVLGGVPERATVLVDTHGAVVAPAV